MGKGVKEIINRGIVMLIIVAGFLITLAMMLKYRAEGETNMPFVMNKVLIISSAEAENKNDNPENAKWNMDINQYNDIYLNFDKNDNYEKEAVIKSITIENINITQPKEGQIELYMPNSSEGKSFVYDDNLKIQNSLTYRGATEDNEKTLQIANQGGTFLFRAVNRHLGEYVSNQDEEIHYDGTLLSKIQKNPEDLKANINFDIVIKTDKNNYRANFTAHVPAEGISQGVGQQTVENFDDVIFKREKQ